VIEASPKAWFPFKRNRLRCVNENRKKRKRLHWQAANHIMVATAFLAVFIYATQAIAFEWKLGLSLSHAYDLSLVQVGTVRFDISTTQLSPCAAVHTVNV